MTREYVGRLSAVELVLAVAALALFVGALVWVFVGDSSHGEWRWLMLGALALSVGGRFLHFRRISRESSGGAARR